MNGQQNQTILNTSRKILAFVVICIVVLSMSLSVFAASDYNRDDMVTISGQTDFDSQYTWNAPYNIIDGRLTYECFTILAEDGTKWYVAVNPRQMQYYQNAFYGKSLVLKGKYKGNTDDGTPVLNPCYLIEGEKKQEIKNYLWNLNIWENDETPNLQAFYDIYREPIFYDIHREPIQEKRQITVLSISEDGSYLSIDSNPLNIDQSSISATDDDMVYLSYTKELNDSMNDLTYQTYANECIQSINSALGLPNWLYGEMCETRAIDGKQKETFDNVTVSWSYHPKQGLEVMYRKNK